ncbi:MAG: hypothetical protein V1922_02235 [bacterium]
MQKFTLSKEQLTSLLFDNAYEVKNPLLSRCIDGRYENSPSLPALAIQGADAGELALIFSAANICGLTLNKEQALKALVDTVGGVQNIQSHTDSHAEKGKVLAGCGHIKQANLDLQSYNMTEEQIDFIKTRFTEMKKQGAQEAILQGDHGESAVVFVKGSFGVLPRFKLGKEEGGRTGQVFVFHNTFVNARHRILAKKLIALKAYELEGGLEEEYVYSVLFDACENHLMETAKRLAAGLPIYEVTFFDSKHKFDIKELGFVK